MPPAKKQRRSSFYACLILLLVISTPALIAPLGTPLKIYDEGLILTAAMRLGSGEVPHLDYWTIYPPGQALMLSAVFDIFGESVLTARILDSSIRLLLVLVWFLLAAEISGPLLATAGGVCAALIVAGTPFYSYPMFPALLLSLLALYRMSRAGSSAGCFGAGVLAGLAALFRQDLSLYALVSLLLMPLVQRSPRRAAYYILGWALPVIVICLSVFMTAGFDAIDQLLLFPLFKLRASRHLPLPGPFMFLQMSAKEGLLDLFRQLKPWLLFYPVAVLLAAAAVPDGANAEKKPQPVKWPLFALTLLCLGQAYNRFDALHVFPSLIFGLLLFLATAAQIRHSAASWRKPTLAVLVLAGLLIAPACLLFPLHSVLVWAKRFPPLECASPGRHSCVPLAEDQLRTAEHLDKTVHSGGSIFVANARNDRVHTNDASLYFLTGLRSASRFHELHPGMTDEGETQRRMVSELELRKPSRIVLFTAEQPNEPNLSSRSDGAHLLDDYIRRNYRTETVIGRYEVLQPRDGPGPAGSDADVPAGMRLTFR